MHNYTCMGKTTMYHGHKNCWDNKFFEIHKPTLIKTSLIMSPNIKHENQEQEHELWKIQNQQNFIMTKCMEIWKEQNYGIQNFISKSNYDLYPKLMLNKLKVMMSYLYLYPFGDLFQRSFYGNFHMFIIQGAFLRSFLKSKGIKNEL
jgi:hypothetical protein